MSDELATAIDRLIEFAYAKEGRTPAEMRQFTKLDREVWKAAVKAGLDEHLPQDDKMRRSNITIGEEKPLFCEGKTALPGDWEEDPDLFLPCPPGPWEDAMQALRELAEDRCPPGTDQDAPKPKSTSKTRKGGRPRKGEKGTDQLILAALMEFHRVEPDGFANNPDPATVRELVELSKTSNKTVSDFFGRKYPDAAKKGKAKAAYDAACNADPCQIGYVLKFWNGERPEKFADLEIADAEHAQHWHKENDNE